MIVSGLPLIFLCVPKTLEVPPTCHKNPAGPRTYMWSPWGCQSLNPTWFYGCSWSVLPKGQQPALSVAVWDCGSCSLTGEQQEGQSQGPGLQPRSMLLCMSSFLQSLKDLDRSIFDSLSKSQNSTFKDFFKIKLKKIILEEELMRPCTSLRIHRQLVVAGRRRTFFSVCHWWGVPVPLSKPPSMLLK